MSRAWKEQVPIEELRKQHGGGKRTFTGVLLDNLTLPWIYYVEVAGFVFSFCSLDEIQEYVDWFTQSTHDSTHILLDHAESHWDVQTKFTRLPAKLNKKSNRPKVIKALRKALIDFQKII